MSNIGIILFFFTILALVYIYITLKDPASPQFIITVKLGVYFSSIYFDDFNLEIYLIFILILLTTIFIHSFYYLKTNNINPNIPIYTNNINEHKLPTKILWIMSLPSLVALYFLISKFGGLGSFFEADGFLANAKHRTRTFLGLGVIKTLITTFYVVHLIYFAHIINLNFKKYKVTYFIYGIHFLIFLFFAAISFSRGTLFSMFIFMGLVWHYSRKRISIILILSGLSLLLFFASILGVVRETVSFRDGEISLNYSFKENKVKKIWMILGTYPLETMLDAEVIDKKLGLTYLSGVTIFVPRSIWPEKPAPGGVVFTKDYTSIYDVYSDFTTGMFPEAIINFGDFFGIIFACLQLFLIFYWLNSIYKKLIYYNNNGIINEKDIFKLLFYIYTLSSGTELLIGEFTNVFKGWIVQIVILYVVYIFIRISNRVKLKWIIKNI